MLKHNSGSALRQHYDAIIVGSGPNGLAAAITLAKTGLSTLLIEGRETLGGGTRTQELTQPGFFHDVCSSIHPLAVASPFFRSLDLGKHGLQWLESPYPLVHPQEQGNALILHRDPRETARSLGRDADAWLSLFMPFVERWQELLFDSLGPFSFPANPGLMLRFGMRGIWPASKLLRYLFKESSSRTLFAGLAGHSILPLKHTLTSAIAMMLGTLGHAVGWPFPKGGARAIHKALAAEFLSLGGEIKTGWMIKDLEELPSSECVLLDLTPRQVLDVLGSKVGGWQSLRWQRFRYGPAVYKIDYALREPIPWRDPRCRQSASIHIGEDYKEIEASESLLLKGRVSDRPFVILTQPSLFDSSRAPHGQHTAWAYCHVPHAYPGDVRALIENQIERHAPGFRDVVIEMHSMGPAQLEQYNPNYIGGDINGGMQDISQMWTRPVSQFSPYRTPVSRVYICSSSTPPGGGVHGMCGWHAAQACLRDVF